MVEHVVIELFDHIEDAAVEAKGGPHRPAGIRGQPAHASFGAGKPVAGAGQLKAHQLTPAVVEGARQQLRIAVAEAGEILLRQVDAAAGPVLAHIPQDVGELVGNAEGHGRFAGIGPLAPGGRCVGGVDPHHLLGHQSHRAGNAIAVEVQLLEAGVAGRGEIHPHALDHVEIGLQRLGVSLQRVHHHPIEAIANLAEEQLAGALLPGIKPGRQLLHRASHRLRAVHQLIGAAAPHVDRPDGTALGRGHQQGAEIEGLGPLGRFAATGLVRLLEGRNRGAGGKGSGQHRSDRHRGAGTSGGRHG